MKVAHLLCEAERFVEVYAQTEGVAAVAAALQSGDEGGRVGGFLQNRVYLIEVVGDDLGVALEFSCTEGALLPCVVNTDFLIVFSVEGYGLCVSGKYYPCQRNEKYVFHVVWFMR